MTDSYLGDNSDEELDQEIKESENLDRTLSEIIEGRGESSFLSDVNASHSEIPHDDSAAGGRLEGSMSSVHDACVGQTTFSEISEGLRSLSEQCDDTGSGGRDSSVSGIPGLRDCETLETGLPGDTPGETTRNNNSGATNSNVILDSDSLTADCGEKDNSVTKGKSCFPLCGVDGDVSEGCLSRNPLHKGRIDEGDGRSDSETDLCHSRKLKMDEGLNPDILSPGQKFPEDWELYDEVVVMDTTDGLGFKVSRTPPIKNLIAGNCSSGDGKTASVPSLVETSEKSKVSNDKHPVISVSTKKNSVLKSCNPDTGIPASLEKIPDVEIIYEPTCGISSVLCGDVGADDGEGNIQAVMLKESTV